MGIEAGGSNPPEDNDRNTVEYWTLWLKGQDPEDYAEVSAEEMLAIWERMQRLAEKSEQRYQNMKSEESDSS